MDITAEILNAASKGNSRAQRIIYDEFKKELFQVCRRYTVDDASAKDMFQEGFIHIYRDLYQFDPQKGSLRPWLRKVMVNSCLQYIRANKKRKGTVEIGQVVSEDLSYFDHVISNLSLKEILKLIQQMPEGYRTVFNLYLIDGYSHKEIAKTLEVSVNTSKTQLFKAKQWMREKLIILDPSLETKYGRQVAQG